MTSISNNALLSAEEYEALKNRHVFYNNFRDMFRAGIALEEIGYAFDFLDTF